MAISAKTIEKTSVKDLKADAAQKAKSVIGLKSSREVIRAVGRRADDGIRLNPYLIVVEEDFNIREFGKPDVEEKLMTLARDIALNGILKPGHVWVDLNDGNKIKLLDGERRLRATKIAIEQLGADIVYPVIVEPSGMSKADRMATQGRYEGEAYTLLERGKLVRVLMNYNWDSARIERGTSWNAATQARYLKIYEETPTEIQAYVAEGRVSATEALKVISDSPTLKDAVKEIETRIANADAKGSKRATAKHSDQRPVAPIKTVGHILREVQAAGKVEQIGAEFVVRFDKEQYAALTKAAKAE